MEPAARMRRDAAFPCPPATFSLPFVGFSLSRSLPPGVHVHNDALYLAGGSAVVFTAEQIALSKADFTHRTETAWRPADVWKLGRLGARL